VQHAPAPNRFAATGSRLDGTALLVAGATEPVWWPPEMDAQRPQWSRRADFPPDRLGLFVCVWAEITDRDKFFDYSVHYRWTVNTMAGWFWSQVPGPARWCLAAALGRRRWR
jgi:hypothetical protein